MLFTTDGRIITPYQQNPKKTNFEERHETKGGQLNEFAVSGEVQKLLVEYSGHVEYWMPAMGDTHEMLVCRELLAEVVLTADQAQLLAQLDAGVMDHIARLSPVAKGWDITMLKDTAELIRSNKSGVVQ